MTVAGVSLMPVSTSSVRASPASTYWAMNRTPRSDSIRWIPDATSISLLSRMRATALRDRVAAVDANDLAVDVRRLGGEQPRDGTGDVLGSGQGAERRVLNGQLLVDPCCHAVVDPARCDHVGAHTVRAT